MVLDELLQYLLADDLAAHCKVINLNNDCLMVEVDSAAWATRLHYGELELLQQLQSHPQGRCLQRIKCCVRPAHQHHEVKQGGGGTVATTLSEQSAQMIKETADSVTSEELKAALMRLSAGLKG